MKHPTWIKEELEALNVLEKLVAAMHHNVSENVDDRAFAVRGIIADVLTALTFARSDIKWRKVDIERGLYERV